MDLTSTTPSPNRDVVRRSPRPSERVRVHMNLNTGQVTVRGFEPGTDDYDLTLVRAREPVEITGVSFRVQDSTYENVVSEGVRDVCAYAVGRWNGYGDVDTAGTEPVRYNPFTSKHFFVPGPERTPVHEATRLYVWSENTGGGWKGRMRAKI